MIHDLKHLVFALSRYKFCAKMLAGRESVLEVGPGDGIGMPIMAQTVKRIVAVDRDACLIEGNRRRGNFKTNSCARLCGVCIFRASCSTETPDVTASQYASPQSEAVHNNLNSTKTLEEMTRKYFKKCLLVRHE